MVRDGAGLARALNRTTMISEEHEHEHRDEGDDDRSRYGTRRCLSITGVTDSWKPNCQGDGCPTPANAAPAPASSVQSSPPRRSTA